MDDICWSSCITDFKAYVIISRQLSTIIQLWKSEIVPNLITNKENGLNLATIVLSNLTFVRGEIKNRLSASLGNGNREHIDIL